MTNTKLVVEVCNASNLAPKDGEGSSSPYVEVDFDHQRHRTKTKTKDLNPVWNEKVEFNVSHPENIENMDLRVTVYTERRNQNRYLLGTAKIRGVHFKKGTGGADKPVPYALKKGWVFSITRGEIFLRTYYYEDTPKKKDEKAKEDKKEAVSEKKEEKKEQDSIDKKSGTQEKKSEVKPATVQIHYAAAEPGHFDVKATRPRLNRQKIAYNLVRTMEYLFVKVVKARDIAAKDVTGSSDPYVEVKVGNLKPKTRVVVHSLKPEWNQVFAFGQDKCQAQHLEITVWDKDLVKDDFLGYVKFEIAEIPDRKPPDSPLAPIWYKLEPKKDEKRVKGDVMLAVWKGTQADEAFAEAWISDTGGFAHNRSKVYLTPKLWYLRLHLIEAQDLVPVKDNKYADVSLLVELGSQAQRTKVSHRIANPRWDEQMLFVAAEPLAETLVVTVLEKAGANKEEVVGKLKIPLKLVEKRLHNKQVTAKWYEIEKEKKEGETKSKLVSRLQVIVYLEAGYHVLDESTMYSSDLRPTDERLWRRQVGVLQLGVIGASGLLPMKTRDGKSCTDAYCVAKYGRKWVRTRTVLEKFGPQFNEQFVWEVYDPCTVLTVGVFDNQHAIEGPSAKSGGTSGDPVIGKVRIRLSTLQCNTTYTHSYPLIRLDKSGLKKHGELELALRYNCSSRLNTYLLYAQPLLPRLHYLRPLHVHHLEILRRAATNVVIARLALSEPPIRADIVRFMLDFDSHKWSYRRSMAHWFRITRFFRGFVSLAQWFRDICLWKSPVTTVLVHILYAIFVFNPALVLPTFLLYFALVGLWKYRFRTRKPPHMDVELSCATSVAPEHLDEEFDAIPTSQEHDVVKKRYDQLRLLAGRIQTVMGDIATQLERFHALLNWRDPRATVIFLAFCILAAMILYVTPFSVIALLLGFYVLRHPRLRDGMPGIAMNFFRRLPALSDRLL